MKEQIRRISAIRVLFERLWSSRSDEHMIYMIRVWELYSRKAKQKYQWIKTTNNIFIYFFLCFCLLIFSPHQCSRAYGLFRQRSKSITDKADATDFIFSRISFTLGFVTDFFAPDGAGLPQAKGKSVRIHAPMAHIIQMHRIKIRERTDPSHQCYPCPL